MNPYSMQVLVNMRQEECRSPYGPHEVRREPHDTDAALVVYTVIMIIVGILMVLFPAGGPDDTFLP